MTLQWAAAGAFAFCIVLGLLGGKLFHLEGPTWYLFLGMMGALGLGSAAIIMYFQSRRNTGGDASAAPSGSAPAGAAPAAGVSEVDHWIREANAQLAKSKRGAGTPNLPMIFVAGDRGTAKTSTILNSGLDPELLAGQLYQANQKDGSVAPTR